MTNEPSSRLAQALDLAERTIPVFPVWIGEPDANGKRQKKPLVAWGTNHTTNSEQIKAWWRKWPDAAIGVPTGSASGLALLDIDPGGEQWAAENANLLLNAGRIHRTERGKHYLFQHFEGCRNSTSKIAPGVDVRGEGGFMVWWPAGFGQQQGQQALGEIEETGPFPDELKDLVVKASRNPETTKPDSNPGGTFTEGSRNDALASEAGRLRRVGYSVEEIEGALMAINKCRCNPSLPNDEVATIASSVGRYEPGINLFEQVEPFDLGAARIDDLITTPAPERQWLVQERLPAGVVGMLAAAGGTGKSMAVLQLSVAVATGLPWFGMTTGEPAPVLLVSAEDDREEMHRRLQAVIQHYGREYDAQNQVPFGSYHDLLAEHLFVVDRVGDDNRMTHRAGGDCMRTRYAERVIHTAHSMRIPPKLIILDPLARFDGGISNDNADATRLIEAAEAIRKPTQANVLLPHHIAKASMRDLDAGQEAVRGASALVDGVRWVGLMQTMAKEHAKDYSIDPDDAARFVRFVTVKGNYAAPWPGMWLERQQGGVLVPSDLKAERKETKERKADAAYKELLRRIIQLIDDKGPMPKRHIEEVWGGTTNRLKVGQKAIRGAITRGVDEGYLVMQPVEGGREVVGVPDGNLQGIVP